MANDGLGQERRRRGRCLDLLGENMATRRRNAGQGRQHARPLPRAAAGRATGKSIRASQLVAPFGVGAVVDLGSESLVCMDIDRWPGASCQVLADNQLAHALRKEIRRPPIEGAGSVPYQRFPRWLFCPNCRQLFEYTKTADEQNEHRQPACTSGDCKGAALVPMRFVAVCDQGHLADVDWYHWAHRNAQASRTGTCARRGALLSFKTSGASGGDFNSMRIACSCGASATFEGLTDRPYYLGCKGRQPWEAREREVKCGADAWVHPRGSANIYYPKSLSALDISAEDAVGAIERDNAINAWLDNHGAAASAVVVAGALKETWRGMPAIYKELVKEAQRLFGASEDEATAVVVGYIERRLGGATGGVGASSAPVDDSQHGLLMAEWPVLSRPLSIQSRNLRTRPIQLAEEWPREYAALFEQVTLIERLREVRALIGFRRRTPDLSSALVPVDLGAGLSWLPGIDLFGEGIFLKFREEPMREWEKATAPATRDRTALLAAKCERWGRDPKEVYSSQRFVALHTLAHALMRRLAFDAGYSSSSLRERIYCDIGAGAKSGILIYTSDADSEGSLGGLVRQGEPTRLLATVRRAIEDLSWCSADPVCSEMEAQGIDGMNAAACHACVLLSETSCVHNNSLLDRRLLVGHPGGKFRGLLASFVAAGA